MLLAELSLNLVDITINDALDALAKNRKFKIKSGQNAFVITFPKKAYVYRVWTVDDGYEQFLRYVKDNSNEHFIKPLSPIRTTRTQDATLKYLKIEKLKPLGSALGQAVDGISEVLVNLSKEEVREAGLDGFIETIYAVADNYEDPRLKRFTKSKPSFIKACFELAERGFMDIHRGNVMLRGSTLVITDPHSVETPEIKAADLLGDKYQPTDDLI